VQADSDVLLVMFSGLSRTDSKAHIFLNLTSFLNSALLLVLRNCQPRIKLIGGQYAWARRLIRTLKRSRQGVWATPPFLHNGAVPNLYETLIPAKERTKKFHLGREFDPVKVGLDMTGKSGTYGRQAIHDQSYGIHAESTKSRLPQATRNQSSMASLIY
jgi:hypothetical protein